MKIKGQTLINDNVQVVVLPRNKENLVFKFKPVINFSEFDNYVKMPEPPTVTPAGGKASWKDFEDPKYKKQLSDYAAKKMNWLFLQSISATDDLEWDLVKSNDPETWHLVQKELEEAQLTITEQNELQKAFQIANSLDEEKLETARQSFLASAQGQ